MQRRKYPNRSAGAKARWSKWRAAEARAQAEREAGLPDRIEPEDLRDVIYLDLRRRGGKLLRIEPRAGYISDRVIDDETGEVLAAATVKEWLHKVADSLPRSRRAQG